MEIYLVGGYVRDHLLGIEAKDKDYVVVGSSPEEMISLGYEQVGASFPVFLKNGEEYALARTERKNGVGYNGFEVKYDSNVTLKDDLVRRDLTINSIAMSLDHSTIYDYCMGMRDLHAKVLRHTSEAFADDPVRVLRTCRFAARYHTFTVHPETKVLMRKIVHEVVHVPMERVWTEFEKGLSEKHYQQMIWNLAATGMFNMNEFACFYRYHKWPNLFNRLYLNPVQKFAIIASGFKDSDYVRLKVPTEYSCFSKIFNKVVEPLLDYENLSPTDKLKLMESMRVFNERDTVTLQLLRIVYETFEDACKFNYDVDKVLSVDVAKVASMFTSGQDIKEGIFKARLEALTQ